ncbi:hypothetical protein RQP46_009758 [Phenoliferia psychrophenolica]
MNIRDRRSEWLDHSHITLCVRPAHRPPSNQPAASPTSDADSTDSSYSATHPVVAIATITDDIRLTTIPKLSIAAPPFTRTARARIEAAGGDPHKNKKPYTLSKGEEEGRGRREVRHPSPCLPIVLAPTDSDLDFHRRRFKV